MRAVKWGCLTPILVVLLGIGAVLYRGHWRASQVDEIYEAVCRYEIQRLDSELSPKPERYYLRLGGRDASQEFMRRLGDLGPRAQSMSAARGFCGSALESDKADKRWKEMQKDPEHAGVLVSLYTEPLGPPVYWLSLGWGDGIQVMLNAAWGRNSLWEDYRNDYLLRRDGKWTISKTRPGI